MRKITLTLCILAGLGGVAPVQEASAAPAIGAPVVEMLKSTSMVEKARLFCYNPYSGTFLHWGACGGRRIVRHPRVYCYNRYTGRFLHWGSCWR